MTIETLASKGFSKAHTGLAGLDTQRLKAMRNAGLQACFKRLEETHFRMEYTATVRGREYINDAAARTVNSTWYSLESVHGGVIWIACGTTDDTDYSRLLPLALRKVRMILVLGNAAKLKENFAQVVPNIVECADMGDALRKAHYYDSDNVKVLFSPSTGGVASTESLGELFRYEVNEL